MDFVIQPEQQVPVVRDVEVVVVGSGVSGLFAALGAAKQGARTLLVDRFGQLGGKLGPGGAFPDPLVPLFRQAREEGRYEVRRDLDGNCYVALDAAVSRLEGGLVQRYVDVGGGFDLAHWEHVSRLEAAVRRHASDSVAFYRAHVPGFERARILFASAHLGARAGAGILGEYWLRFDDFVRGARFDDVVFRNYVTRRQGRGHPDGCDMPYRMLIPRQVDGLLVAARGASFERRGHDSPPRPRCSLMMLGEVAGRAAALAAADRVPPRHLDVRKLQRVLLGHGFFLGEEARLRELGLRDPPQ